jgi:hypothetical protein
MANRIWQGHFGRGIAGNPNNFGTTGKKPTHPRLLDWLAQQFIDSCWSVKHMHRLIMMSDAYRRSSTHPHPESLLEADPLSEGYATFSPRRLTAEELRDSILAVSGELNLEMGGIPVRPEINQEVALQPRMVMGTFGEAWQPSPRPEQRHRRSIYALRLRGLRDPYFEVFNAPSPDLSTEHRDSSTITPQVFTLLNSDASYTRALAMASRLLKESGANPATAQRDEIIDRAFELTYGRTPTGGEKSACVNHWVEMSKRHKRITLKPTPHPTEVVREAVEENTGEPFSFREPLEAAVDFQPDIRPEDVSMECRGLAEVCLVLLNSNEFVYVY